MCKISSSLGFSPFWELSSKGSFLPGVTWGPRPVQPASVALGPCSFRTVVGGAHSCSAAPQLRLRNRRWHCCLLSTGQAGFWGQLRSGASFTGLWPVQLPRALFPEGPHTWFNAVTFLTLLIIIEQGTLHFHFAQTPTHDAADPGQEPDLLEAWEVHGDTKTFGLLGQWSRLLPIKPQCRGLHSSAGPWLQLLTALLAPPAVLPLLVRSIR